jgi:glycine betaine catabolism B
MHPIHSIIQILDRMTMYRVVMYALFGVIATAFLLALSGLLAHSVGDMALSFLVITGAAIVAHTICARISGAPANSESSYITAFILFLIVTPAQSEGALLISGGVAALSIVLKYVVVYRKRHVCNPAALGLLIGGLFGYIGADWWVGSRYLLPVVLIAAVLVVLKVRRFELFLVYVLSSAVFVTVWFIDSAAPLDTLMRHFLSWPTIFFAGIMLTEPLGLPSTRRLQYVYALLVALLSSIPFHVGSLYGTPELALIVGNLFTFIADRPERFVLTFQQRTQIGNEAYEYHFTAPHPSTHVPGQYLEWTLPHERPDLRGIRRYFTIVSRPGDETVSFAVRHVQNQSTFKQKLETLTSGDRIYATQRAGDFTLHQNARPVWIAGGIGITPFISMIRAARAKGANVDATLFNCNKTENDALFNDEIADAINHGLNAIDILGETPIRSQQYELGFITEAIIQKHVPEWRTRTYYISGPPTLVSAYEALLRGMGIPRRRIVTDYFPGLA